MLKPNLCDLGVFLLNLPEAQPCSGKNANGKKLKKRKTKSALRYHAQKRNYLLYCMRHRSKLRKIYDRICLEDSANLLSFRKEKLKELCEIVQKEYKNSSKFYSDPRIGIFSFYYFGLVLWLIVSLLFLSEAFSEASYILEIGTIFTLMVFFETTVKIFMDYNDAGWGDFIHAFAYALSLRYDDLVSDSKDILYLKSIIIIKHGNPYMNLSKDYEFLADILDDRRVLELAIDPRFAHSTSIFEVDDLFVEFGSGMKLKKFKYSTLAKFRT